jgi:hypothetical protein
MVDRPRQPVTRPSPPRFRRKSLSLDGSVEVLDGVITADVVVSFRSLLLKGTAK